ncbi:hypothetical protein RKD42_008107 [Streptomyces ambofaciens]
MATVARRAGSAWRRRTGISRPRPRAPDALLVQQALKRQAQEEGAQTSQCSLTSKSRNPLRGALIGVGAFGGEVSGGQGGGCLVRVGFGVLGQVFVVVCVVVGFHVPADRVLDFPMAGQYDWALRGLGPGGSGCLLMVGAGHVPVRVGCRGGCRDCGRDAAGAGLVAVDVVVVAAVGEQWVRLWARMTITAADGRDRVEQGQGQGQGQGLGQGLGLGLGDVVAGCRSSAGPRAGCRSRW